MTIGTSAVALVAPVAPSVPHSPAPVRRLVPVPGREVDPARPAVSEPALRPERIEAPVRPARRPVRRSGLRPGGAPDHEVLSAAPGVLPTHDVQPTHKVQPAHETAAATEAPMRLTVRGIRVLAVLSLVAAAVVGSVLGLALPTDPPAPTEVATVVVAPGQSLWTIAAEHAAPGSDLRVVIDQIMELNSLTTSTVVAGQELTVPAG